MFYLSREAKEGVEIALVRGVMGCIPPSPSIGVLQHSHQEAMLHAFAPERVRDK
jgi:hypothetical protein